MNTAEPPLLRWLRSDLKRFWMIVGGVPILLAVLQLTLSLGEMFYYSPITALLSFLGFLPDVLVLRLFLTYIERGDSQAARPASDQPRLFIEATPQAMHTGSIKDFFWDAAKTWGLCFVVVWVFSWSFYGRGGLFSEAIQFVVSMLCYCFALQQTRLVQRQDSHDAASRLLGAAALYLVARGLSYGLYVALFFDHLSVELWRGLAGLGLSSLVLVLEQQRYTLARSAYHLKSPLYQLEAIDPQHPTAGLSPLAYWPEISLDGVLYRVEQSNVADDPFRNNQVRVPLFVMPTQPEPFMGLLARRLYLFIGLFLLSLLMVFSAL